MKLPEKVKVIEIGPRDGFQNVKDWIPTEFKLEIIDGLVKANFKRIQCTSFVNPKAIPQTKDAKEIVQTVLDKYKNIEFYALTPNLRGVINAWEAGLREVVYVISVSEEHNKANVRRTHEESFEELKQIRERFPEMKIQLDAATAFACPFKGRVEIDELMDYINKGIEHGVDKICLCDTIGVANPLQMEKTLKAVKQTFPNEDFCVHIHDTRNMGIANALVAIQNGFTKIETSIGGLGGCPFAPGATGNTATEDLVNMLMSMGIEVDIDFKQLLKTARKLKENVNGNYSGHLLNMDEYYALKKF